LFILATLCGCRALYPSIMLQTDSKFKFTPLPDSITSLEYKISPNDFVNFRLFSNDGFRLIDYTNISDNNSNSLQYATAGIDYLVEQDGDIVLPTIGRTHVAGLTIRQATDFLEKKYSPFYVKPYVLLKVTNRRVIVFPGSPGAARVIPLVNNNTTLIEALASAGGITEDGKAWNIKVIRGDPNNPQVFLIDLSTIYGVKEANMVLQANDIVYVTPQRRFTEKIVERITPTLTLLTSLVSIILTIALLQTIKL
jgi:polysaccharide biosynthesis/export protein